MKGEKAILVVEDSERLNDFISSQLQKNGYTVTQAFNGKQAFKNLQNGYFDLVILDIKLGEDASSSTSIRKFLIFTYRLLSTTF